jgi:hypothetical protein
LVAEGTLSQADDAQLKARVHQVSVMLVVRLVDVAVSCTERCLHPYAVVRARIVDTDS